MMKRETICFILNVLKYVVTAVLGYLTGSL